MNKYAFSSAPGGAHQKIIQLVAPGSRVLDVGCNTGYLACAFKEKQCFVAGIENEPAAALEAEKYCDDLLDENAEEIQRLAYPEGFFDYIIFADILEHLREPEGLVLRLLPYLGPEGRVIVSLPNIARLDIRLKLFFGKFDYTSTGILDKTHLRFFTLGSARRMLEGCGLKILDIDYTGLASTMRVLPTFFAFQFIFVCTKQIMPRCRQ